ncbi:MAG: thiol-disulfide oxidoreductase DCC family protein [Moraxellaceae bacterium]|nr:MAG: thiol-disulfide oxidoreductase DCC family protein [Moraxellaceae bacterium]
MENLYPPHVKPDDQIIMFDGVCKLCKGWSRFIIRFDSHKKFKLCAVQSGEGQAILAWLDYPTNHFDTMLLVQGNRVLEKSDSFLAIVGQLPFPWRFLRVLALFPKRFRDWFYDRVASNRYKLFGKYNQCQLAPPDHAGRFL